MTVLDRRTLNRATLTRQLLTHRDPRPALDAIEHLVGMQAQAPFPPYYGLWTRLTGFRPAHLAAALEDRRAVRLVLMRGTVHLVTAADATYLRPLVQPVLDRDLRANTRHAAGLTGLDLTELAATAHAILDTRAHTAKELGAALARHWPDRPPTALAHAARGLLPLVQIPPRAVWGRSGQPTYRTARHWLGRDLDTDPDPATLVRRYLAAYGPATIADLQTWSGLTRLRDLVTTLDLPRYTDEHGRELHDLPDTPRPDPDLPVPVRFLPEFDNVLLSHADRTRIMTDDHRKRLFSSKNGLLPATILVDGFLHGTWRTTTHEHTTTLTITPWTTLSPQDTAALADEGARLLTFAHPDTDHDIVITPPG